MPEIASKMHNQPITIVGLGAVGRGLVQAFHAAAFRKLILIGKGHPGEQRLSHAFKRSYLRQLNQLQQEQGVIILALKETDLGAAVQVLSQLKLPWRRITVLHTSGSLGAETLSPLAALGAGVAAWHPYQTFPRQATHVSLDKVTFGIDGNRRGVLMANRLARALGGVPLKVSGQSRVLYHLSAVLACGFLTADLQMAVAVLKHTEISERRAVAAVLPIARETIRQCEELGIAAAMTGPAVRGDTVTIKRHLRALKEADPELAKVYKAVTEYVLASQRRHS